MQGERRGQVYLDYAEPKQIFVQASAIELAHIAERSRNIELVKIRATYQVAIKTQSKGSCKFVRFVGKKNPVDKKK